jgi:hypothetical protein
MDSLCRRPCRATGWPHSFKLEIEIPSFAASFGSRRKRMGATVGNRQVVHLAHLDPAALTGDDLARTRVWREKSTTSRHRSNRDTVLRFQHTD